MMTKKSEQPTKTLAFKITNDLLFAEVIAEDISPTEVQILVQARLSKDPRFREQIIHLNKEKHPPGRPKCNQWGNTMVTNELSEVNCLRCLGMYDVQAAYRISTEVNRDDEET